MLRLSAEALPCCQLLGRVSESCARYVPNLRQKTKQKIQIDICARGDCLFLCQFTSIETCVSLCVLVSPHHDCLLTAGCALSHYP